MSFVERFDILNPRFDGRAYVHEVGFHEAFEGNVEHVRAYLFEVLRGQQRLEGTQFVLAAIWGNKRRDKVTDLFAYSDIREWPGNPTIDTYNIKNGLWLPTSSKTCGDALIVLGEEERHRRTTPNLTAYLKTGPDMRVLSSVFA